MASDRDLARSRAFSLAQPSREAIAAARARALSRRRLSLVIVIVGLLVAGTAYYLTLQRSGDPHPVYVSPKDNSAFVLTRHAAAGNGLGYPIAGFQELPPDLARALTPRDAARIDDRVVPKDFAGGIVLLVAVQAIGRTALNLHVPIGAMATLLFVFLFARALFGVLPAMLSVLLLAVSPPFWLINSSPISPDTFVALWFAVSIWCLAAAGAPGRRRDLWWFAGAGLALGISITFRYSNAILILPLLVGTLVARPRRLPPAAAFLAWLAPGAGFILAFNAVVYGSPLTTGYGLVQELLAETLNPAEASALGGALKFTGGGYAAYIRHYFAHPIVFGPVLLGVAIATWRVSRRDDPHGYGAVTLLTFLLLVAFNGARETSGVSEFSIRASILRYLLPVYLLAIPLTANAAVTVTARASRRLAGLRRPRLVAPISRAPIPLAALLLLAWLAVSVDVGLNGPRGVRDTREAIDRLELQRAELLDALPDDSVVVTRRLDKLLFPERLALVATFLAANDHPIDTGGRSVWSFEPGEDRIAAALLAVHAAGRRAFVLDDSDPGDGPLFEPDRLNQELRADQLALCRVPRAGDLPLYEAIPALGDRPCATLWTILGAPPTPTHPPSDD